MFEQGIENGIRYLVGDLVWMAFRNGFRSKKIAIHDGVLPNVIGPFVPSINLTSINLTNFIEFIIIQKSNRTQPINLPSASRT